MAEFKEERDDFEEYCKKFTKWDSEYIFSYDLMSQTYDNEDVEHAFQLWFAAWSFGYDEGHLKGCESTKEPDVRFGIEDKIRPELLSKKIKDWS